MAGHGLRQWGLLLVVILLGWGCTEKTSVSKQANGLQHLIAWAHAGRQSERETLEKQVSRFNQKQDEVFIELKFLPEGTYNSQVQAAALAGDLPDLLEFDGPMVYNYVWQGHLIPIPEWVPSNLYSNTIPSIIEQGTYRGRLYSLGQYDSGLALYARKSLLEKVGARIPTSPAAAWTVDEFEQILSDLAQIDPDKQVLDLKFNYRGEWYTYAFMPVLVSAGGDLIDRDGFDAASGVLNSAAAVQAMKRIQSWAHEKAWVDENLDDVAFTEARVALSWVGHWEYPRYKAAWGNDLVLVPLPDFGQGSRTAQGSWNWGVTTYCGDPAAAVRFMTFLLDDQQVLEITQANGAVPATFSALDASGQYHQDSLLNLFKVQLTEGYSVPRPRTPAYPIITAVFQQAFDDIRHGADVQTALDQAAAEIDRDLRDNRGYPAIKGDGQ